MLKQIFSSMLVLALSAAMAHASGGDHGPGNADTDLINRAALKQLLENDGYYLKMSMLNYLETLNADQIPSQTKTDVAAKAFFKRVSKDSLKSDIALSPYVVKAGCAEDPSKVTARTTIGTRKSEVCFDLDRFFAQTKTLSPQQRTVQLASLAFHEEVHHFQNANKAITVNEDEAYGVSAYVLNTATHGTIPVLKWLDTRTLTGKIVEDGISGDRSKGLMAQLRATGGESGPGSTIVAKNIKCENANLVFMNTKVDPANPTNFTYRQPWIGCSANPLLAPSALEGFILSSQANVGLYFMGMILIGVENRQTFDVLEISCVTNSDRCHWSYRESK